MLFHLAIRLVWIITIEGSLSVMALTNAFFMRSNGKKNCCTFMIRLVPLFPHLGGCRDVIPQ